MEPAAKRAKRLISGKAERFTESVIREMTRQAMMHGAINLAQGFPDFPAPEEIKRAAQEAIAADINQYAITWGAKPLREAIARQMEKWHGIAVDAETRDHGVLRFDGGDDRVAAGDHQSRRRGGDLRTVLRKLRAGHNPVGRAAALCDAAPSGRARASGASTSANCGRRSIHRTKAIIVNTPNNPTGKVFTRAELETIRDLCVEYDALAITDEIYEHILYDGAEHISMATLDGMRERTITINGMSKTYSVTGWRVGWAVAPPELTNAIRKVHDFLTVGAAAPLQEAGAVALSLPESYYERLARSYCARRDRLLPALQQAGFKVFVPRGAYYIMTDIGGFGFEDDVRFAQHLVKDVGVAVGAGIELLQRSARRRAAGAIRVLQAR